MAFQDPSLLPWLSLERNVAFGLDFKHQPQLSAPERRARVDAAIDEVGLGHAPPPLPGSTVRRHGATHSARPLPRAHAGNPAARRTIRRALDEVTREEMQHLLL